MPMCVLFLSESARKRFAYVIITSGTLLALVAFVGGIVAARDWLTFRAELRYFVRLAEYDIWSSNVFGFNIVMAGMLFCWSVGVCLAAYFNATPDHRWSFEQVSVFMPLIQVLCFAFFLISIFSSYMNFRSEKRMGATIQSGIGAAMSHYEDGFSKASFRATAHKIRIDNLQRRFKCCGIDDWSDWLRSGYRLHKSTAILLHKPPTVYTCGDNEACYIPWSCCLLSTTERTCFNEAFHLTLDYERFSTGFYPIGCARRVFEPYSVHLRTYAFIWIVVLLAELVIQISWRFLSSGIYNWYYLGLDAETDPANPGIAPAWLSPVGGYPAEIYYGEAVPDEEAEEAGEEGAEGLEAENAGGGDEHGSDVQKRPGLLSGLFSGTSPLETDEEEYGNEEYDEYLEEDESFEDEGEDAGDEGEDKRKEKKKDKRKKKRRDRKKRKFKSRKGERRTKRRAKKRGRVGKGRRLAKGGRGGRRGIPGRKGLRAKGRRALGIRRMRGRRRALGKGMHVRAGKGLLGKGTKGIKGMAGVKGAGVLGRRGAGFIGKGFGGLRGMKGIGGLGKFGVGRFGKLGMGAMKGFGRLGGMGAVRGFSKFAGIGAMRGVGGMARMGGRRGIGGLMRRGFR